MTTSTTKKAESLIHSFEDTKEKAIKHATSWKAGCLGVLIGLGIFAYLGFRGFMIISGWYDNNRVRFQYPVEVRSPVIIEKRPVIKEIIKKVEVSSPKEIKVAKINDSDIISMIKSYDWDADTMVALAKSENFWNLTKSFDCGRVGKLNYDGSQDYGLFQINTIHTKTLAKWGWTMEDMKDCKKNIEFAYKHIYKGAGLSAWSAYNNGSYLAFLK